MSEFVDEAGRKWSLRVDVNALRKVRSKRGIDLAKIIGSQEELNKLIDDPCLWVDIIWDLIEQQASTQQVTPQMFGEALAGDAFESASSALLEAIIDFFPAGRREILRRLLAKVRQYESKQIENLSEKVESLTFGE